MVSHISNCYHCKIYIIVHFIFMHDIYNNCKYHRLFIVVCLSIFGIKEPEDEHLCKAVLILFYTYETLRLN